MQFGTSHSRRVTRGREPHHQCPIASRVCLDRCMIFTPPSSLIFLRCRHGLALMSPDRSSPAYRHPGAVAVFCRTSCCFNSACLLQAMSSVKGDFIMVFAPPALLAHARSNCLRESFNPLHYHGTPAVISLIAIKCCSLLCRLAFYGLQTNMGLYLKKVLGYPADTAYPAGELLTCLSDWYRYHHHILGRKLSFNLPALTHHW